MKKQFVVIGIIILLVCIGFSGCSQVSNTLNTETNKFVGSWKGPITGYPTPINSSFTFLSDGTYSSSGDIPYFENFITGSGIWDIKDGKLVLTLTTEQGMGQMTTLTYQFSNNDRTLFLRDTNSDITMNLIKQ